jgi:hypothetical protein
MSRFSRRRPPREPDPRELEWQRNRSRYQTVFDRLTRGLVRVSTEDARYKLGLSANPPRRTRLASLSDPRKGNEPVAYLYRVPGVGLLEVGGIGGNWYLRAGVYARFERTHGKPHYDPDSSASRSHLPRSRLSLAEYEHAVRKACRSTGCHFTVEDRYAILAGWRKGTKPFRLAITLATRHRHGRRR